MYFVINDNLWLYINAEFDLQSSVFGEPLKLVSLKHAIIQAENLLIGAALESGTVQPLMGCIIL